MTAPLPNPRQVARAAAGRARADFLRMATSSAPAKGRRRIYPPLSEQEANEWADALYGVPGSPASRKTRRSASMVINHFRGLSVPHAEALAWFTAGLDAPHAHILREAGFTPDDWTAFLALMGSPGRPITSLLVSYALNMGPGWPETRLSRGQVESYVDAGVGPVEAVDVWEARRVSGEDIDGALAMLKALRTPTA